MAEEMESRTQQIKYALFGLIGIGGGIFILFLRNLGLIGGLITGGIILFIGLGIISSKKDGAIGLIVAASGAFLLLSKIPILGGLAAFLLTLSGWVLIIGGGVAVAMLVKSLISRV